MMKFTAERSLVFRKRKGKKGKDMEKTGREKYYITGITSNEAAGAFAMLLPVSYFTTPKAGRFLLGVYDENKDPVAVCWYMFTGYDFEIMFIGVHPLYRRKGIGSMLLQEFLRSINRMNTVFPVKVVFSEPEASAGFHSFLRAQNNFFFLVPDIAYKVTKQDRDFSVNYQKLKCMKTVAKRFFDQPEAIRKNFLTNQHNNNLHFLDDLGRHEKEYDKDICFCCLAGAQIGAALFTKKTDDDEREISYLYVDERHPQLLAGVLSATVQTLEESCPDADLIVRVVNENSRKMLRSLFPEPEPISWNIECAMWDFTTDDWR